MAICKICNVRKGKRECKDLSSYVCSQCCGAIREREECEGCPYFEPSGFERSRYGEVPRYSIKVMADDFSLNFQSRVIEDAISYFDRNSNWEISDAVPKKALELLMDKLHFNQEGTNDESDPAKILYTYLLEAINMDLANLNTTDKVKMISTVYASIKRHDVSGKRGYLDFIKAFFHGRVM